MSTEQAAAEQRCADHADLRVDGTCIRCGRFICAACPRVAEKAHCAGCAEVARREAVEREIPRRLRGLAVESAFFAGVAVYAIAQVIRAAERLRGIHAPALVFVATCVAAATPFLVAAYLLWRGTLPAARAGIYVQLATGGVILVLAFGLCTAVLLLAPLHSLKVVRHLQNLRDGKLSDDPDTARLVRRAAKRRARGNDQIGA